MGDIKYGDKGNMTKEEIDKTIDFLIKAKQDGQFRAFWKSFDESVNLMASGEVVIQSMWSPAVTAVRSQGIDVIPAAEGRLSRLGRRPRPLKHLKAPSSTRPTSTSTGTCRAGSAASSPSRATTRRCLETAKEFMTEDEWGYWVEGKPAKGDIMTPDGKVMEKAGAVRDGGSFDERMGKVACWNSVMDEDRYMVQRWNEFIAA